MSNERDKQSAPDPRPGYEPPRALRMGDTHLGSGGFSSNVCIGPGSSPGGSCQPGAGAADCNKSGNTAGQCNGTGSGASTCIASGTGGDP
jgi:hypothetical protein